MSCVCDSGVLTAGGGVRSRSVRDGICNAEGCSQSSSTNKRRFSTRHMSRSSALDSAGGANVDADSGMSGGRSGGGSCEGISGNSDRIGRSNESTGITEGLDAGSNRDDGVDSETSDSNSGGRINAFGGRDVGADRGSGDGFDSG